MSDLKGIAPPRAIRAAAWFLCAWLASACGTQSAFDGGQMDPAVGSIQELLVREYDARVTGFPQTAAGVRALGDHQVLVFIASEPRTPILSMDPAVATALRAYVRRGGALLLLGYAARMVYELGLESAPPDRFEPYLWGLDQKTLPGDYRYGIRMVSARVPELVAGLTPEQDRTHVYFLGGGELAAVQSCHPGTMRIHYVPER